jgi:hypothetical protein
VGCVIFDTCMHGRIDYMETYFFFRDYEPT